MARFVRPDQWFFPLSKVSKILLTTGAALLIGAVGLYCYAYLGQPDDKFSSITAAVYLTACATFAVGFLVGCLFGVPQTIQDAVATPAATAAGAAGATILFRPSNQLQQVSDWLVKIILGASLTQVNKLSLLGDYLKDFVGSPVAGVMISVYFTIVGFWCGYFIMVGWLGQLIREASDDLMSDLRRADIDNKLQQSLFGSAQAQDAAVANAVAYLRDGKQGTADTYGHLACAIGQKYERLSADTAFDKNSADAEQLRMEVVSYAQEAIRRDPEWRVVFRNLNDGPDLENDLAIFKQAGQDPNGTIKKFLDSLYPAGPAPAAPAPTAPAA
ncbi:hypothetical protein [Anatilimnocola floriformis]|uniref:hypothetical protein n=1 Tax=Anatilimnocola floriformis TaxID=2948575 RepID=UPI0020C33A4F|nr:hypothetical protein [Anatilimnocola floriformis]